MAGGKETPRQKMIGMMYLVLTALLALNVSKAILDAFVAIEESIQVTNENEYNRGQSKIEDLQVVANDASEPETQKKAIKLLAFVNEIDILTKERIKCIDGLKLEILQECGEDIKSLGPNQILLEKYSSNPLEPLRMNLEFVNGQDKYDEPMRILIGDNIKKPNAEGLKLWNSYTEFRENLVNIIVKSAPKGDNTKPYKFNSPNISKFKNAKDLEAQMDQALSKSIIDLQEVEDIKKIYLSLCKNEYSIVHEVSDVHWIGKTFDHAPVVAAIASLTSLQKEILTARADAINVIRNRVTGGQYSFNKLMAIAYGPEIVNQNDEIDLNVLMVAYNSDKQPLVTMNGNKIKDVADGKGNIKVKASGSEMNLSGEISITNKSGQTKTLPWSKNIRVMKPSGTVSLMDMKMVYRGHKNRIEAVASGYEKTLVSTTNGVLTQENGYYVLSPNSGNTCTITVSGKNEGTGKVVNLGSYVYKVSQLPPPSIKYGNNENGAIISKSVVPSLNKIFAVYPSSIPLDVNFKVIDYKISLQGYDKVLEGSGNIIDPAIIGILRQAKSNSMITITAKVEDPGRGRRYVSSSYTIR